MRTHAAVPIAESLGNGRFRIYFSSRDSENKSYTGFVEIAIDRPHKILNVSTEPVLVPGALGEFDDSGSMATWLTNHRGIRYLYYIGWNLGVTVPFRNSIGLSVSTDSKIFNRYVPGPIVDRTMTEPHFCASCCVLPGDDVWRMWYLSCIGWRDDQDKLEHKYHIKYAESSDGINWRREGVVAIDLSSDDEYAISRPSVLYDEGRWKMWYSYRGKAYRIGYAESSDGIHWVRHDDKAGITVSESGWDSEMIEYPYVFLHDGQKYMLYNGNDYGRTGFGLAVLE